MFTFRFQCKYTLPHVLLFCWWLKKPAQDYLYSRLRTTLEVTWCENYLDFIWKSLRVFNKNPAADTQIWFVVGRAGDSCCSPLSMGSITRMVKGLVPGVYVRSLEIGNGIVSDTLNGFFMPIADQVGVFVCILVCFCVYFGCFCVCV